MPLTLLRLTSRQSWDFRAIQGIPFCLRLLDEENILKIQFRDFQRLSELTMDSKTACRVLFSLKTEAQRTVISCPKSPRHSAAHPRLKPVSQAQGFLRFLSTPPLIYAKPLSSYQKRKLHSPLSTWANVLLWFLCGI